MKKRLLLFPAVLPAILLALASAPSGQAQGPAAPSSPREDPIVLSVFEVTSVKDEGYQAANTQAGARIAVPIRELPLPISVMTRDLLDDLGVTDIFQASRMATGGEFANRPDNDTNFQFRGITNAYQTRNYFVWYLPTDTYNSERIEVLRGPLGVLYGDAAPGGLLNVVTKRAQTNRDFTRLGMRLDGEGSVRGTVDHNQRLGQKAAFRANAVWNDAKSWKDFVFNDTKAAHFSGLLRPTKTTSIRVEGEYGDIERHNAANVLVDQYTGKNVAGSTLAPSAGPRALLMPDGTLLLNNATNNTAAQGAATGQGIRQSNGSGSFILDPDFMNGLGANSRTWAGPSNRENRLYKQYAAFVEQKIGDKITLELAANVQDQNNTIVRPANSFAIRQDPTPKGAAIITNTTVNPAAAATAVNPNAGRYYVDHAWVKQIGGNYVRDFRATAAYVFDRLSWTKQRVVLTAGQRRDDATFLGYNEALKPDSTLIVGGGTAAGNNVSNNAVTRRFYLDTDYGKTARKEDPRIDWAPNAFGFDQLIYLKYASVAMPGSFTIAGKERLHTLFGYRRDHFTNDAIGGSAGPGRDAYGNLVFTAPRSRAVDVVRNSRNAGAVLKVLEPVSLFVNYGESFRPISGVRFDGSPFGAQDGEGLEYGLKFELLDGRLSGAVSRYTIQNKNAVLNVAANVATELRNIFPTLPTGFNAQDSQDVESKGFEIEIQANLAQGWTLTANFAHNNAETTNVSPAVKELRSRIDATTNPGNLPTVNIDNYLAGLVEPVLNAGVRPDAFNLFTRYNFSLPVLKGAYVGAGMQWRSETFMGYTLPNPPPTAAAQIVAQRVAEYLPGYHTYNLLLGYSFKPSKSTQLSVNLNVDNLFDKAYVNAYARGFGQWGSPRSFVLNTSLSF